MSVVMPTLELTAVILPRELAKGLYIHNKGAPGSVI